VVLKSLTDGKTLDDFDAKFLEQLWRTDPGELQQLRRVDGASANYNFSRRAAEQLA
jgi:hypothetical protein